MGSFEGEAAVVEPVRDLRSEKVRCSMSQKNVSLVVGESQPIAFADYVDGIRIAAPYMKSLALTLSNAQPSDLDARAKKQVALLVDLAKHADDVLDERQSVLGVRQQFLDFGSAWGALYDALVGKSRLPATLSERGPRAAALVERIFPDGAVFIRRDAHAAWSDGDRRLALILEQGLKDELDEVAGEELFEAAKKATTALGEALGVGRTRRDAPRTADLQATVLRFSREVARYARLMAADVDVHDAASVERFRKAVAGPIDALRSRRVGEGEGEGPTGEPGAPITPEGPTSGPVTPSEPSA